MNNEEITPGSVPEDTVSFDGSDMIDQGVPVASATVKDKKDKPVDAEGNPLPEDRPQDYVGYVQPRGRNPYVISIAPVFGPSQGKDNFLSVSALPCDTKTFNSLIESYPSINYDHGSVPREWAAEISRGSNLMHNGAFLSERIEKDGSEWCQRVPRGAGPGLGLVTANMSKIGGAGPGAILGGDVASMKARQILGLGETRSVPMWHSGLWVTLKAPTTAARLELQRRISSEKIMLGRMTDGLAFSNTSAYIKAYLADFAVAHITAANARYAQPQELKSMLLVTDIPALIWGMLVTMYPGGYPYHQPCMRDPSSCNHVVHEHIDLTKIFFTDRTRFTEGQLARMEARAVRATPEQLDEYRQAHYYVGSGKFELQGVNGKLTLQLKVPTIAEYISAGLSWVDGISNAITQAFGSDLVGERRNDYILERAKATDMCEYSHWVKSIGLPDGAEITEEEVIRSTLSDISGTPELSSVFFTKVHEFMENCTVAMTAIPKFDCPACGQPATEEEQKHPYLNPIDVEALFFMTLDQHIEKALSA